MAATMADAARDEWEIFDESVPFLGGIYGPQKVRMAVVGLGGGRLLVITPGTPMTQERWSALEKWGTPAFLLAPNHFHNLGVREWVGRYPSVRVAAHPTALPRLKKRLPEIAWEDLTGLTDALPKGMRLFSPPQAKQGETTLSLDTAHGRAWFVTDNLLNWDRFPKGPLGWMMWLVGFRTHLQTNPFFKRVFLTDKNEYKQWIKAELDRDPPTFFVPSHGLVLRGPDVADRLRAATEHA